MDSNYETGKRTMPLECMVRLVDYYNVSIGYLVFRTDISESYNKVHIKKCTTAFPAVWEKCPSIVLSSNEKRRFLCVLFHTFFIAYKLSPS